MKRLITLPVLATVLALGVVACSNRGSGPSVSIEPGGVGTLPISVPTTALSSTPTTKPVETTAAPTTQPVTTKAPAPVTTQKPAPTTTVKAAAIPSSEIQKVWSALSAGTALFFDKGDLSGVDAAVGAMESKYKAYGLTVVFGGSGGSMTLSVNAAGYSECRHVDLSTSAELIPGC
jgi:hypothetical protein